MPQLEPIGHRPIPDPPTGHRGPAPGRTDGPIGPELRELVLHRPAWLVGNASTALALGVVFNMTTKPGTGGSILVLAVATLAGLALGYLGSRPAVAVPA